MLKKLEKITGKFYRQNALLVERLKSVYIETSYLSLIAQRLVPLFLRVVTYPP